MIVLDLDQRTSAWHEWRAGGLGGSDAPPIMGVGFVSADELLAEKLGQGRRESSYAMRRGLRSESPALVLLEERRGAILRPACVQHDEVAWLRASLDGLDFWGELAAEIKAPNVVDHEIALGGVVPQKYVPQVQHQLLVTGLDLLWYVSYSIAKRFGGPEAPSLAVVEVEPDAEFQAELLAAEEAFWARLCAARELQEVA